MNLEHCLLEREGHVLARERRVGGLRHRSEHVVRQLPRPLQRYRVVGERWRVSNRAKEGGGIEGPAAIVWGDRDPILGRLRKRTEQLLPHAEVTRTEGFERARVYQALGQ